MIEFLRCAGLINAAVWFGAACFYFLAVAPASGSEELRNLLGTANAPYFSKAIGQIFAQRFFYLQLVCGCLALLHVTGEWLYLGKVPRRAWMGLLLGLVAATLILGLFIHPKLRRLNVISHATNVPQRTKENAAQTFRAWQMTGSALNLGIATGLALYFWRLTNPPNTPRFVSAVKF